MSCSIMVVWMTFFTEEKQPSAGRPVLPTDGCFQGDSIRRELHNLAWRNIDSGCFSLRFDCLLDGIRALAQPNRMAVQLEDGHSACRRGPVPVHTSAILPLSVSAWGAVGAVQPFQFGAAAMGRAHLRPLWEVCESMPDGGRSREGSGQC